MRIMIAPLALIAGILSTTLLACGDKDADTSEEAAEAAEQEEAEEPGEESEESEESEEGEE